MVLKPIRVLVVTDTTLIRNRITDCLRFIPRVQVVGNVSSDEEALALVRSGAAKPHVVLLDFPMLRGKVATIRALRRTLLNVEVLALVSFVEDVLVEEAQQAGVIGCLPRNNLTSDLLERAILFAYNDMKFLLPTPAEPVVPQQLPITNENELTGREHQVLGLLAKGLSNQRIADELVVTRATVKFHTRNIQSKLGTKTRTQTVAYAREYQLVPDE
jgi:two-component system, NarL family, response regulator LiaR